MQLRQSKSKSLLRMNRRPLQKYRLNNLILKNKPIKSVKLSKKIWEIKQIAQSIEGKNETKATNATKSTSGQSVIQDKLNKNAPQPAIKNATKTDTSSGNKTLASAKPIAKNASAMTTASVKM